jgi:uncharacterized membrane protein YhaH (DUF805 family)
MEWAILPLKRYAQFTGRSRRKEYWMFVLLMFVAGIVASILDGILGLKGAGLYGPLSLILMLGVLIPSIAVGIRRLHDTDRSGWWILIALIPLVGAIILIVFYATDGTNGSNQYGPDPKTGDPTVAF